MMVLTVDEFDKREEAQLTNSILKLEELIDRKLLEHGFVDWPELYVHINYAGSETFNHTALGLAMRELSESDRQVVRQKIVNDYIKAGWHASWDAITISTHNSRIFRSDKIETRTTYVLDINKVGD